MAVYCDPCRRQRDMPFVAVRVSPEPCQFCGGFDSEKVRVTVGPPGQRRRVERVQKMNNYSYPDRLIPSMPGSVDQDANREYEGK